MLKGENAFGDPSFGFFACVQSQLRKLGRRQEKGGFAFVGAPTKWNRLLGAASRGSRSSTMSNIRRIMRAISASEVSIGCCGHHC